MIDSININGVRYSVTPAEEGQSGNIFTYEGVTYSIGEPVTPASNEIAGSVDKISVGGKIYDIRDKEEVGELQAAITQMGKDLSIEITETVNAEAVSRENADKEIRRYAANLDRFSISRDSTNVSVSFHPLDNSTPVSQNIPAATSEKAGVMSAEDKKKLDGVESKIEEEVEGITTAIQENAANINAEATRAKEAEQKITENASKEKTALINGDTIVGVAREVYSRQGKTDTATFLRRTTAGGTSISDGVASIKHIGGYCVKNLVDGTFDDSTTYKGDVTNITKIGNGIIKISSVTNMPYSAIYHPYKSFSNTHIYYNYAEVLIKSGKSVTISINGCTTGTTSREIGIWHSLSAYGKNTTELKNACIRVTNNDNNESVAYIKKWLILDLTEMYGDGNEPTKEECDKMFATMGTLPQGISVAQPTGFNSIGFNQWNPANKLEGKGIINNTITDAETDIAFMECLPCKVGTGENNGYIIGYGEGDSWNDTGVEVYFSPNSVYDTDGAYIQKLTKDATYNTYVPRVAGYLFIVTPTTEKLCAHLHWSGDREVTDYEEYVESNVTLPTIPQMSEWGLAGVQSRGTLVCDEIDFERGVYIKRIGIVDLGSLDWVWNEQYQLYRVNAKTPIPNIAPHCAGLCREYPFVGDYANAVDNSIGTIFTNYIFVKDSKYTDAESLKVSLQGVILYYEFATPAEYPIVTKAAPNYIGSDYGVEQFTGSKVPLAANILFYMRSLVSETRNFLDRLMAGLGTSDATVVADRILAAVNPTIEPTNIEPEAPVEQ